jgi:GGDEF domain-containing protein
MGHAVVVARAPLPGALRRVREIVADEAPAGTQLVDLGGGEVCVLVPSDSPLTCRRIAGHLREALQAGAPITGRVEIGWAIGTPERPPARAVAVARAMVSHGGAR